MPTHPSRGQGHVTLEQVAEAAGVSLATASRVLSGKRKVAPEYRDRVLEAARKHGYSPNRAARALASRKADCVGLILPAPSDMLSANAYFPRLVAAVESALSARGTQLAVFLPPVDESQHRLADYAAAGHVDGLIVISYDERDVLLDTLQARGIPVVACGRPLARKTVSYVDCDHIQGSFQAVGHLADQGCTSIATIAGSQDSADGVDRLRGYREALESRGMRYDQRLVAYGDYEFGGGQRAIAELLRRNKRLDGVYVAGELMALGALAGLQSAGRRVPDDVAIVAFDDSPPSATTVPPLTSVAQPIEDMGRELVGLLMSRIEQDSVTTRQIVLGTTLVVRASSTRR